jgi:ABC-type multidrug transport system fused ATPase/permease subunit
MVRMWFDGILGVEAAAVRPVIDFRERRPSIHNLDLASHLRIGASRMSKEEEPAFKLTHYSNGEVWSRMWPMLRPYRTKLILASLMITYGGFAISTMPMLSKYVIDVAIIREKSVRLAVIAVGIFLLAMTFRMMLWYFASSIVVRVREEFIFAMRAQGFHHLQRLCLRFHSKYPSGFLHDRIFIQSICAIGNLVSRLFGSVAIEVPNMVFSLVFCLYLSVPMTIVILVGAVCFVATAGIMGPRLHKRTLECTEAHNWICHFIQDRLRGNKTIQAFALEDHVGADFDDRIHSLQMKYVRASLEQQGLGFVTESLSYLITGGIMVIGAYGCLHWREEPGTLVAFIGYQAQFIGLISGLTGLYGQISATRAGFDQYLTILDTRSTVIDKPAAAIPDPPRGEIAFENVNFAYDSKQVLHDVSFKVPSGQRVALVGRSGAGKTTITSLLLRFYDPDRGRITFDGLDVRSLPLRSYRSCYGVVLQEAFLFDDTIEENLKCIAPHASPERIREALQRAQALEFVNELPDGLRYRVGEGGCRLSGGQRQRLAIARCMLLEPTVLILDEATSALDNEAEAQIKTSLDGLFKGHTVFVVAHRLSTIRDADRIMVFDRGLLVEEGSYQQLLDRNGLFRHLHDIAISPVSVKTKLKEAGFV